MFFRAAILFSFCFTAVHATWSPDVNLSPAQVDFDMQDVAVNSSGDAVAVWDFYNGSKTELWSSFYDAASQTWSPEVQVTAPFDSAGGFPYPISVGFNDNRIAVVSFPALLSGRSCILSSTYSGGIWSVPQTISDPTQSSFQNVLTMNNSGQVVVSFFLDSSNAAINVSSNNGGSWLPSPIAVTSDNSVNNVSSSLNSTGNALIVWDSQSGGLYSIKYAIYNFPAGLGSTNQVTSLASNFYRPSVSYNAAGQAVAGFADQSTGGAYVSLFDGVSWSITPTSLSTLPINDNYSTAVAMNGLGEALVVWREFQPVTGLSLLNVASFDGNFSSPTWSTATTLSDPTRNASPNYHITTHVVTLDDAGNGVVIWDETTTASHSFTYLPQASTLQGGVWSPFQILSDISITDSNPVPRVGLGAETAIALWPAFDGTNYYEQASTFPFSSSPAQNLSGSQKSSEFPFQKVFFNKLQWSASSSTSVVAYNVYRDGTLIGTVPVGEPLEFTDSQIQLKTTYTYSVRAVDSSGAASTPISITIYPKN